MKTTITCLLFLCFFAFHTSSQKKPQTFALGKSEFLLNGKPFQIISGEIHPARIPEQYWKHRIQMAKAMGCNTIAAYYFWNYHEAEPGSFDFETGNRDVARFIRTVQEEGMWLSFRPGPYVCAEWDFGGLPWWLLRIPDIKVRCMDPRYIAAAERYIAAMADVIREFQINRGGPVVMLQLENEYGSYGNDRNYMQWLKETWIKYGIEIPFYTADGPTPYMMEAGTLPGVAIGLDSGTNEKEFAQATKANPDVPSFCSELYPGWLTHWGEKWQRPDTASLLRDVRWLMNNKKSFNFYVIHGGTNFGYWAGANAFSPTQYQPDVTSYDYDAPINEAGQPTAKYQALRKLLGSYLPKGKTLPPIPEPLPAIEIPEISFTRFASVWDNLPPAIASVQPKPMEMFGQPAGFILYRTRLTGHKKGKLRITELHDYATVFVDGKYIGKLDRAKTENIIDLPESQTPYPQLDILVEGMGRINFAEYMIDRKGITERVSLNGMTLMNWQVYLLPLDEKQLSGISFTSINPENPKNPGLLFRGEFNLSQTGDSYLDLSRWNKGVVWVNGHNLGRYWEIGPQFRLFCPAPFLRTGKNEIIVFDLHATQPQRVTGHTTME
jgi:beta-galactosidase GanA